VEAESAEESGAGKALGGIPELCLAKIPICRRIKYIDKAPFSSF
jgi:hypothetical protein